MSIEVVEPVDCVEMSVRLDRKMLASAQQADTSLFIFNSLLTQCVGTLLFRSSKPPTTSEPSEAGSPTPQLAQVLPSNAADISHPGAPQSGTYGHATNIPIGTRISLMKARHSSNPPTTSEHSEAGSRTLQLDAQVLTSNAADDTVPHPTPPTTPVPRISHPDVSTRKLSVRVSQQPTPRDPTGVMSQSVVAGSSVVNNESRVMSPRFFKPIRQPGELVRGRGAFSAQQSINMDQAPNMLQQTEMSALETWCCGPQVIGKPSQDLKPPPTPPLIQSRLTRIIEERKEKKKREQTREEEEDWCSGR